MKINPLPLEWKKRDELTSDFDLGAEYSFEAETPFGVKYCVVFDHSEEGREMLAAYVANGEDCVPPGEWEKIHAKYGDPSDVNARWSCCLYSDTMELIEEVVSGVNRYDAQVAAQFDFAYRINASIFEDVLEPDFGVMFNLAGHLAGKGIELTGLQA